MLDTGRAWRGDWAWWLALGAAALFFAAHVPFLASALEDVDSINFALGVRDFDPAAHRPHPPGYPLFIALAKLARLVLDEPRALAIWAALFGALTAWPLLRLFQACDAADAGAGSGGREAQQRWWRPAPLAVLVTLTAPLFWISAARPMSDSVGLALAVTTQALLATAFVRQALDLRGAHDAAAAARSGRLILVGALVAALSVGIRSQALWLTAPLLVFVLVSRAGRGAAGAILGGAIWFARILIWLVPLVVATGGPGAYIAAFSTQAGQDWQWIDLLVTRPSLRALAQGLLQTFITHWAGLGPVMVAAACAGALAVLRPGRRAWLLLAVAYIPYGLFHLLFQELVTTRYALPLVVPVAYLAVRGAWLLGRVPATVLTAACSVAALLQVVPVTAAYSAYGSPAVRAIADVSAEAARTGPARLARRHTYARALEANLEAAGVEVLVPGPGQAIGGNPPPSTIVGPGAQEDWLTWRDLPRLLTADSPGRIWLFDTPQHLLVSLIAPAAIVVRRAYRWPFDARIYLGGVRPSDVDWIEIRTPSWVVGEGWHLTPDTAGRSAALGKGLGAGPIAATVRTRDGAATVMIGGRHLGAAADADVRFTARLDDLVVDAWTVSAADPFFLRVAHLPAGALRARGSPWRPLVIEAVSAATGAPAPRAAVEQFDLQDAGRLLVGYGAGWHEHEFNPATGLHWRWASASARIRVAGAATASADVDVTILGESPRRSFGQASTLTLTAGDQVLGRTHAADEIAWTVRVPASALDAAGGVLTLATDQTFRPAERGENADRRVLGLRIYRVSVTPAS